MGALSPFEVVLLFYLYSTCSVCSTGPRHGLAILTRWAGCLQGLQMATVGLIGWTTLVCLSLSSGHVVDGLGPGQNSLLGGTVLLGL